MMLMSQHGLHYQCQYSDDTNDLMPLVEGIVLGIHSAESNSEEEPQDTCRCGKDLHHPVESDFVEPA